MSLTLAELFTSPDHYLHSFVEGAAVFVPMDREAYRRSVFLDDRIAAAKPGTMRVPLGALLGQVPAAQATGWIFHVAHCGSTLLANALDELGPNLVLREPLALRQLALAREFRGEALAVVLAMLAKRYEAGAPNLVKANVPVNFILGTIAAQQSDARAIMLYLQLEDYLCAILRSDNHRQWLRGVSGHLAHHLGDPAGLSDAALAARLWQAQAERYLAALAAMPQARSLDGERLFADPVQTSVAAARHLGLDPSPDAVARLAEGAVFQTYSKRPGIAFSNADRLARRAQSQAELADEIAAAQVWLETAGCDIQALTRCLAEYALP